MEQLEAYSGPLYTLADENKANLSISRRPYRVNIYTG